MRVNPVTSLNGTVTVPGDKSISHRSIMLGSIAKGQTTVKGFLMGADCLSTVHCFRQMGIDIDITDTCVTVSGKGLHGLKKPNDILDVGNSGTTIRLISGILSGQNFESRLTGDSSIQKRPMNRIIKPLSLMNASIRSIEDNGMAPLEIKPSTLKNIDYNSPVASAQVKSSIMLASLYTDGVTTIDEPYTSRNHSELMLNYFGANIQTEGTKIICNPVNDLVGNEIFVPADISSAAFFIVAGLITPRSEIKLLNVCINPTRDGIIKVMKAMNGDIELDNIRNINGEEVADIIVRSSHLKGTVVEKDIIPTLIDEIPVIAVAAAYAEGETVIKDAAELKVKESNRIDAMVCELSKMGADIKGTDDGMIINGGTPLKGATIETYHDHRIAMSLAIASLNASSDTVITNSDCIQVSFPGFFETINMLSQ